MHSSEKSRWGTIRDQQLIDIAKVADEDGIRYHTWVLCFSDENTNSNEGMHSLAGNIDRVSCAVEGCVAFGKF